MISNSGAGIGIVLYVLVILALAVLSIVATVVLIRLALVARRTLLVTTSLQEARLELIREQTARLQADDGDADGNGGPYVPGSGPVGPAA
jgi:predicted Holliday junction resolvase-like endonuclease